MLHFILNNENIATDLPPGGTVLDFVRYHKNLKGTKIGCREGDCGACTVLVGELLEKTVSYRTMTSCLMPMANASGKHIVTIEGINPSNRGLTPVQQSMIDESGTQCGFCTVGFVMSLTGFCLDETDKTPEMAVSAIDGNICRCTGYKSIERAAQQICNIVKQAESPASAGGMDAAIASGVVPKYFGDIPDRLKNSTRSDVVARSRSHHPLTRAVLPFVGGGTDVYVQRPDETAEAEASHLFYDEVLRGIRDTGEYIEIGASATVTDLLVSPVMQAIFPDLYKHLKLVSSTPIRNMATLAGNFVNASPIGDMTVWFLALDAEITLAAADVSTASGSDRGLFLRDLYRGYKQLAKSPDEYISKIRFPKPTGDFRFNFEKVSKRTNLDISTVNMAISLKIRSMPADDWLPPALQAGEFAGVNTAHTISEAHVAAGGVFPIPLYLKKTSAFLIGKTVNQEMLHEANEIMQSEVSPISDVRGTDRYKRLLLRQLFTAHFVEMFGV